MNHDVREATLADAPALGALWSEADALHHAALPGDFAPLANPARTPQDVAGILDDPEQVVLGADAGTRIVELLHVALRERLPPMVEQRFAVVEAVVVAAIDRAAASGGY